MKTNRNIISYFFISKLNRKSNGLYKYQEQLINQLKKVSDEVILIYNDKLTYPKTFNGMQEIILVKDSFFGFFCDLNYVLQKYYNSNKKIYGIYNDNCNFNDFLIVNGKNFTCDIFEKFFNNNLSLRSDEIDWMITTETPHLSLNNDLFELVKNYNLPFIKIDSFCISKTDSINVTLCNELSKTINYICKLGLYDAELIYDYIIERFTLDEIKSILNLNYFIDKDISTDYSTLKKTGVFVYLYYDDLFEESIEYLKNIPPQIDIYVATNNITKISILKKLTYSLKNKLKIIMVNARGRDIAVFFTEFKKYLFEYDYACFLHDKKSIHMGYTSGKNFRKILWDNTIISENYINQILKIFDLNDYLGMLVPPNVYHGGYFSSFCNYWGQNFDLTETLLKRIDDKVPVKKNKAPVSVGSVFWFKTLALRPIFKLDISNKDFPAEPFPPDGTIAHAIERLFPYVAQSAGYLTATVYNTEYAALELDNFRILFNDFISSTLNSKDYDNKILTYNDLKEKINDNLQTKFN